MDVDETRRAKVAQTARLVEFLRELARTGQPSVYEVDDHEVVRWLCELRTPEIDVDLNLEAGPGDVVFSMAPVVSEPPPPPPPSTSRWISRQELTDSSGACPELSDEMPDEAVTPDVLDAYDDWASRWEVWAEADRELAPRRSWFDTLARLARHLEQQDDSYELVIGTGLLSWTAGNNIRHPLLTTPADLRTDPGTGRIDVSVAARATTRIGDRQLLEGESGFEPARPEVIRDEIRAVVSRPLADDNKDLLSRWRSLALERARPYEHIWEPTERADEAADLRFAPALILRQRDRTRLIDYFDQMLAVLAGPEAVAPLGLAQLLTALEPDDRMAWLTSEGAASGEIVGGDPLFPLAANPEQRQIIERLIHDNGVVVQGPPGTGKTHTIANLLSALLARGQRVLVTSQKAQALRVLRDKLPPTIQQLCVSLTDLGRSGSQELDESVTALSDRYSNFSPTAHEQRVTELSSARDHARTRVADLKERIRALRESETYRHPPIAAGYQGTKGQVAERLRSESTRCSWMPVPFPAEAPADAPLSTADVVELRRLLATGTPERTARSRQVLPDLATLPTGVRVRDLIGREAAAAATAREAASELSAALARVGSEDLSTLQALSREVAEALHQLRLEGTPEGWPATWYVQALADGFSGRDMGVWHALAQVAGHAAEARDALTSIGLRQVLLPAFDPVGNDSLAGQVEAGRALREHLAAGNAVKRRMRPAVQKRAGRLLDGALVNGVPVTNLDLLDVVLARLGAEHTACALAERWTTVGVQLDQSLSLDRGVAELVDLASTLDRLLLVVDRHHVAEGVLARLGILVGLRTAEEWLEFSRSLDAVRARIDAEEATQAIAEQVARLELEAVAPTAPPEIAILTSALAGRDADLFEDALARLARAAGEQAEQRRCDALWEPIHGMHPVLADRLRTTASDDRWEGRLSSFGDAWAWGKARTLFDQLREEGLEGRLAAQLTDAIEQEGRATAALAAEEAWGRCLERMTAPQEQALRAYKTNMADRGAGHGRWAHRYAAAARQAMTEARGAVPAWIMPLREVVETIPPDANSFDVIIVDEASQASIEALFLLWLAPRVIVVGDERQCAPSQVIRGQLQPIFDRLDDYLYDVPDYLRLSFTPKSNLFSLLSTRFGSVVRLREHFRCMPEIIGWSSRMFYRDEPLVPLRQFGSDRLTPVRTVHVPGATTEGSSSRLRNRAEAEAIVEQIKLCIDDPAYAGKTFGVVVLQGSAQIRLIDDLLQAEVPQAERERRRLRVGNPPDFQGDERHVVFLSLVVAERPRAVSHREWQRRFNVAASRAQDQMWLFHSVTLDLLRPGDLRHSLLSYSQDPPAQLGGLIIDDLDWSSERHDPFDSLFEQRVYLALRDRGFHVTPQHEVNGRRIDLVVTGAKGRLAVECDGDHWHASHESQLADIDRQIELERADWQFWRVRESEFYLDPEAALASLWIALERRGIRPGDVDASVVDDIRRPPSTSWAPDDLSDEESTEGIDDPVAGVDVWESLTPRPSHRRLSVTPAPERRRPDRSAAPDAAVVPRADDDPSAPVSTSEVREWARSLRLPVGERGRLGPEIVEAWDRAHPFRPYQ